MAEFQEIELPSGKRVEVPSGMAPDKIRDALMKRFPEEFRKPESNEALNTLRIAGTGAVQGVANVGDTAQRVLGAPPGGRLFRPGEQWQGAGGTKPLQAMGLPTDPDAEAKRLGAEMTPARKALASGARVGAEVATMGGGVLPSLLSGVGAGLGRAATGSEWGEIAGAIATPVVAGRLVKAMMPKPPTTADLRAQKTDLYKQSERAGAIIKDRVYGKTVNQIGDDLEKVAAFGNPILAPKSKEVLKLVEKPIGEHMTLEGAEAMRRMADAAIKTAARQGEATDVMLLEKISGGLRDMIKNLGPNDLVQGNRQAVDLLNEARAVAQKYLKTREVEKTIKLASTRAASPDLALRNEFATLARRLEKQGWAGYSAAEKEAVEQMTKPSGMRKLIRAMGYAPYFAPGYGEAGKKLAETMATKQAGSVAELMRRGGPAVAPEITERLRKALLLGGAATVAD